MDAKPAQSAPENPYVGPIPFLEGQTLYGRKQDTQAIAELLTSKRIVLLIAPSGAGKTSLIQAALVPRLRSRLDPLPVIRLDRAQSRDVSQSNRYVLSALRSLEARFPRTEQLADTVLAQHTLASYCASRIARGAAEGGSRFPLLILDQFEELFTLDRFDWEQKRKFIEQLANVLGGPSATNADGQEPSQEALPPMWALLSMREDHVAELEPFLDLMPTGLAYRYRLEPLDREQAIEAIVGPAGDYFEEEAASRLVDDLRKLRAPAPDGEERWQLGRYVEPVQLQVVCLRLWDKVVAAEGRPISLADITAGGQSSEVDNALAGYYEVEVERAAAASGVRQRDLRDWIEARLITQTKIRTKVLREPAALGKLDTALQALVKGHVLRVDVAGDREWFELSHDRMINPILRNNEDWRNRHLALVQKQAKLWAEADRPDDLLFSGQELDEAKRFASEHPEELGADEIAFLEASERERERIAEDVRQRHEIEDKNQRLRRQRRVLTVITAVAMVSLVVVGVFWKIIADQKDKLDLALADSKLLEALALARAGDAPLALGKLLEEGERNQEIWVGQKRAEYELKLIEVLGRYPPIERKVGRHGHIVRAVEFSADGALLYSGGWDNKLKVWPLAQAGAAEVTLEDHRSNIYSLAYHGASGLLASTDEAGLIHLWRAEGGPLQRIATLNADQSAHKRQVTSAAFNAEGTQLATSSWDKRIVLWDVSDAGASVKIASFGNRFHLAPIYRIAFLERGRYAGSLVSADLEGRIGVWSRFNPGGEAGQKPELALSVEETIGKKVGIYAMALSPSGRWLAAGDSDGNVLVWDLEAAEAPGKGVRLLPNRSHRDKVMGMAFSPDSHRLVTVGSDEALLEWRLPSAPKTIHDLETKIHLFRLEGWGEKLYSVAFHPQRDGVVAVGGSRKVRIADLNSPNPMAQPIFADGAADQHWRMLAATPDLGTLATLGSDRETIRIWRRDGAGYQPLGEPPAVAARQAGIALSPGGKELATISCEGELVVWPLASGGMNKVLKPASGPGGKCPEAALSFSPDGNLLAVGTGTTLQLWSRTSAGEWRGDELARFDKVVLAVAFSPQGSLLAAAGEFGRIRLWDIANGKASASLRSSADPAQERVTSLAFHPDGKALVSGGEDATVWEWDVAKLAKGQESLLHTRAVTGMAFGSRQGLPALFSADREGQLVLCSESVSDENCVRIGGATGSPINGLAVDATLEHVVVAGDGLWVWDLRREAILKVAERLADRHP